MAYRPLIDPIVPRCNMVVDENGCFTDPCTTCTLVQLADNILQTLIALAVIFAIILFVYAGWILLKSTVVEQVSKAKKIFWNTFFGLIIVLAAWLIVDTGLKVLLSGQQLYGQPWADVLCDPNATIDCTSAGFESNSPREEEPDGTSPGPTPENPNQCGTGLCTPLQGASSFGVDTTQCNGGNGAPCVVRSDVSERIAGMAEDLGVEYSIWTITSAYEPTRPHVNQCHLSAGTCIDLAASANVPNGDQINRVISAGEQNGLRTEWEVGSEAERQQYLQMGVPANRILVIPGVRPHFSVYCSAGGQRDNNCDGTPSINACADGSMPNAQNRCQ